MKVIRPVEITDAQFVSSTITEADASAWSSGTTYALAARVMYQHNIYESLQASNTNKVPTDLTSASWWLRVKPTNRWSMFDQEINTATVAPGTTLTAVVAPGQVVDSVVLLDVIGDSVTVTMTNGGPTVFTTTVNLNETVISNWYEYFFEPYQKVTQKVITGLPLYASAQISVTVTASSGTVSIGGFVVGSAYELGDVKYNARAGITDYSRRTTNVFGYVELKKRLFAKRMDVDLHVPNQYIKRLQNLLADIRSTPCAWIGVPEDTDTYAPLVVFGYYKDFTIAVEYPTYSTCSLQIEGMV